MTMECALTNAIKLIAQDIDPGATRTSWYVFGSYALGSAAPSDFDLMVICDEDSTADSVRRAVETCRSSPLSIHLSIFTLAEEKEINAIARRDARRIA